MYETLSPYTLLYFKSEGREKDYIPLSADENAIYNQELTVDLDALVPMAAKPHSPDNVDTVANIGEIKVKNS